MTRRSNRTLAFHRASELQTVYANLTSPGWYTAGAVALNGRGWLDPQKYATLTSSAGYLTWRHYTGCDHKQPMALLRFSSPALSSHYHSDPRRQPMPVVTLPRWDYRA